MVEFNLDKDFWQWVFFAPWLTFYIIYNLIQRNKISKAEERNPINRPIIHWVLLGLSLLAIQLQPNDLEKMKSINVMFIVFSLFVADGYWDYKTLPRIFTHG